MSMQVRVDSQYAAMRISWSGTSSVMFSSSSMIAATSASVRSSIGNRFVISVSSSQ